MPSFPPVGSVTICEINRDLITADEISEDRAREAYGKLLGVVFSPVPFQFENLSGGGVSTQLASEEQKSGFLWAALKAVSTRSINHIFHPIDVKLLPGVDICGLSWHQHKHMFAFISGPHQVTVCDYEDSDGKNPCILINESQKDVKTLEWRPNGGRTLSVACKGGICIWASSYPGNAASVRTGVTLGTLSRGSGTRWTLVDFLRSPEDEQVSALSWSPSGRYLASASFESSSFTVWDVAQGVGTPIRRGLGGISLLKWSPSGDYFFAAKFDGTFYLWETNTWTSEPWSSTNGFVTGAAWDPDGSKILISFSGSSTLGSIHFATKPPSLDAHLIPVELPEMQSLTGSEGVEKIAWDASGERLALSYKDGEEAYKGLIAIYDVRRNPLISASLIGFIRGPGDNPKPVTFSFHDKFKQGPLLSVCWSTGFCLTYPLIFRSHVLP
ncbi:aladin [Ipomoea triloba]|uniref:aladin n=1 Tax=Ipomoea triloba TaxID=35885 RepID=UPI00125E9484|nr:aladin [Ipomoea triloba]XP_031126421.1 aladin [Ipomoea triloba]